jgi:hypothetical protein
MHLEACFAKKKIAKDHFALHRFNNANSMLYLSIWPYSVYVCVVCKFITEDLCKNA